MTFWNYLLLYGLPVSFVLGILWGGVRDWDCAVTCAWADTGTAATQHSPRSGWRAERAGCGFVVVATLIR